MGNATGLFEHPYYHRTAWVDDRSNGQIIKKPNTAFLAHLVTEGLLAGVLGAPELLASLDDDARGVDWNTTMFKVTTKRT